MIFLQINTLRHLQVTSNIRLRILLPPRPSIPKVPRESIPRWREIFILIVFPAWLAPYQCDMRSGTRPHARDIPTGLPAIIPGATVIGQRRLREESPRVRDEFICGSSGGRYRAYTLTRHLAQDFGVVGDLDLDTVRYSSRRPCTMRARDEE